MKITALAKGASAFISALRTPQAKTPASLAPHAPKYKDGAWRYYRMEELGNAVSFFAKRSTHRTEPAKRHKDLADAQNYLDMLQAKLDALKDGR